MGPEPSALVKRRCTAFRTVVIPPDAVASLAMTRFVWRLPAPATVNSCRSIAAATIRTVPPAPDSPLPASRPKPVGVLELLPIVVLAIVVNARALANRLVYDDLMIVANNPHFATWKSVLASIDEPYWYWSRQLYRPLTTLSLGVDKVLGGGNAMVFHLENLLLHGLATLLVGLLAARWLPRTGVIVTMIVFAVHPVHVEVISTAVGRAELLCAVFLLSLALVASREAGSTVGRRLAIAALAAAALASKEVGIIAPVLAFAIARIQHRDWKATTHDLVAPAFVGILPILAMRFMVLGELKGDLPHPALVVGSIVTRIEVALSWLPVTMGSAFVPRSAPIDVAPSLAQILDPPSLLLLCGAAIVIGGAAALLWHVLRPSAATLGAAILVLGFLPVANLFFASGVVASGRTLYVPSVGAAIMTGALAAALWYRGGAARSVCVLGVGLWAITGSLTSFRDIALWRDEAHLRDALLVRQPQSYRGYVYAAELARSKGEGTVASGYYLEAVALFPNEKHLLYSAANASLVVGDTARATEWLGKAVEIAPEDIPSRTRLVKLSLTVGDTVSARTLLDVGLRLMPDQKTWRQWREQLD
jgi:hypothetical protein